MTSNTKDYLIDLLTLFKIQPSTRAIAFNMNEFGTEVIAFVKVNESELKQKIDNISNDFFYLFAKDLCEKFSQTMNRDPVTFSLKKPIVGNELNPEFYDGPNKLIFSTTIKNRSTGLILLVLTKTKLTSNKTLPR